MLIVLWWNIYSFSYLIDRYILYKSNYIVVFVWFVVFVNVFYFLGSSVVSVLLYV